MIKYDPCEPFRAYNRIEGRPREEELEDALAAKVHDPLWMLARQYQFGELKGEDAGSAIFAKVAINSIRMSGFSSPKGQKQGYSEDIPLETRVERLVPVFDFKKAVKLGKKFLQIFEEEGAKAPASLGYSNGQYSDAFKVRFPFVVPQTSDQEDAGITAAKARTLSLQQATAFLRTISGKALDGVALWDFFSGNYEKINDLILAPNQNANDQKFILSKHKPIAQVAVKKWISFFKTEFNLPENEDENCWYPERLEYSFKTHLDEGNDGETELNADEYFHGHLDWYSFDVSKPNNSSNDDFDENIKKREVLTVIPTEASFAGMPASRWWEMEDGSIDLGNLKASDTDIAKILVTQFALQYSNDWLSIPYDLPTGCYSEVEGVLVRDTFGLNYFVEPAHQAGNDWNDWNMYSLTIEKEEFEKPEFDKRILLPPAIARTMESDSLEEIKFIRDEMANLVWAIETRIPDGLGEGMDAYEAAGNLSGVYERLKPELQVPDELTLPESSENTVYEKATTYKAALKYQLGNSVGENWIPFIPVHQNGSNREIHFQRASMPRINELYSPHAVRPRTQILRDGIDENDNQAKPLFINEEEIPRAGVKLTATYQRTRWYHGKVVTWYGRKKRTGRGEGSSGLRFDLVLENNGQ